VCHLVYLMLHLEHVSVQFAAHRHRMAVASVDFYPCCQCRPRHRLGKVPRLPTDTPCSAACSASRRPSNRAASPISTSSCTAWPPCPACRAPPPLQGCPAGPSAPRALISFSNARELRLHICSPDTSLLRTVKLVLECNWHTGDTKSKAWSPDIAQHADGAAWQSC
jgi:hypothetical protein